MRPTDDLDPQDLATRLGALLVGQPDAVAGIVPFIQMAQAGLAPEDRPLGVVLMLGPTGSGKTRTVEALAQVLHRNYKNVFRIDCGEYVHDQDVAKLIGSPPGYLGHKETIPLLNQSRINGVSSEDSDISLVLFDEIEKATPSLHQLLLGILDKAVLRLGDNSTVHFDRSMIFLTSNLGAKAIQRANCPDFGYEKITASEAPTGDSLQRIGLAAVRRKFSPEFVNRIDSVITYQALDRKTCALILNQIIQEFGRLIYTRLGLRSFTIRCAPAAQAKLLDLGVSVEFGARNLKRTVQRHFIFPLAALVSQGEIRPGSVVTLDLDDAGAFRLNR
jgi:ATP-dependent Clp protease ATP-binding subunit ClpA